MIVHIGNTKIEFSPAPQAGVMATVTYPDNCIYKNEYKDVKEAMTYVAQSIKNRKQ